MYDERMARDVAYQGRIEKLQYETHMKYIDKRALYRRKQRTDVRVRNTCGADGGEGGGAVHRKNATSMLVATCGTSPRKYIHQDASKIGRAHV